MNIVNSGNTFTVYGEEVQTHKTLPANTYKVCFSPMSGFSLQLHDNIGTDEKIYGRTSIKVDKVLKTFDAFNRNMGIILSGPKGAGKSMFARLLAERGRQKNLPLILVDRAYDGLADFLASIKQECIILFDEFEKNFINDEGQQDRLLSMFDGVDAGKKLYVVTCNEVMALSKYFINRPGRFHYHFTFGLLSQEEVREYLEDNLVGDARKYITDIMRASMASDLTYDILRAIVFELNNGYGFRETMEDLNIEKTDSLLVSATLEFEGGIVAHVENGMRWLDLTDRKNYIFFEFDKSTLPEVFKTYNMREVRLIAEFSTRDLKWEDGGLSLDVSNLDILCDSSFDDEAKNETVNEFAATLRPEKITISKLVRQESRKLV